MWTLKKEEMEREGGEKHRNPGCLKSLSRIYVVACTGCCRNTLLPILWFRFGKPEENRRLHPTNTFAILKPQNPGIGVFEVHENRRSADFNAV